MSREFWRILRWMFILCATPVFLFLAWVSFNIFYKYTVYDHTTVRFENGFVYAMSPEWKEGGKVVLYPDGRLAVRSNVRYVEASKNFVYGLRRELTGGTFGIRYYFICEAGQDCAATQSYGEEDFERELKQRGLSYAPDRFINSLMWLQLKTWCLSRR